jgi:2Fe-2S ferredoxin
VNGAAILGFYHMAKVTFVAADGATHDVEVEAGESLMRGAVNQGVPGILAECGGACACATCGVVIDPVWADRLPRPEMLEESMLDEEDVADGRRLSCQIIVTDDMDGLVVRVPSSQH